MSDEKWEMPRPVFRSSAGTPVSTPDPVVLDLVDPEPDTLQPHADESQLASLYDPPSEPPDRRSDNLPEARPDQAPDTDAAAPQPFAVEDIEVAETIERERPSGKDRGTLGRILMMIILIILGGLILTAALFFYFVGSIRTSNPF